MDCANSRHISTGTKVSVPFRTDFQKVNTDTWTLPRSHRKAPSLRLLLMWDVRLLRSGTEMPLCCVRACSHPHGHGSVIKGRSGTEAVKS